jgi:Tol biopolymer transport system component
MEQSWEIFAIPSEGGKPKNLTNHPANDITGTWSPDGSRIAFASDRDGNYEIYVMDTDGSNQRRLTFDSQERDQSPSWSTDGKQIAFAKGRFIYVMSADGKNERKLTEWGVDPAWAPDGKKIAFYGRTDGGVGPVVPAVFEICVMDVDGGNRVPLTNRPRTYDHSPAWSPDGSQIAFVSENQNNPLGISFSDIFLMNANGSRQRKLTKRHSTFERSPTWSPDGRFLAFLRLEGIYVIQSDGEQEREIFAFPPFGVGYGGLSWFDPDYIRAIKPSGKLTTTWGWIKE